MRMSLRLAATTVGAAAALVMLAGCIQITPAPAPSQTSAPSSAAPAVDDERAEALDAYVAAEQAQIPAIMSTYPGTYSAVDIEGGISTLPDEAPGEFAVIAFTYTYANAMDWEATASALDAQTATIEESCQSQLFSVMEAQGVSGPKAAVYSYTDEGSAPDPRWSYTCTTQG